MARERLTPSGLFTRNRASVETTKRSRTSTGAFVMASEDKTGSIDFLEKNISNFTMIPSYHGEIISVLIFLSDVEEGGETMFPFESGLNMNINYGYKECIGMKVRPRKDDSVLFYATTLFPCILHLLFILASIL